MLVTSITLPLQAASNGRNYMHYMAHYMLSKMLMTYQYVRVHTGMYKLGILVLACTALYWYVLVRTSTYHFAQSCPGVQDSRWSKPLVRDPINGQGHAGGQKM